MEYKKSKALEEATYDLDDDSKSSFCMINGANFTSIDGVDYAGLDSSQKACAEDEVASWTIVITQGRKMGEVMDRVPFGRFNKLITGLGATTLEIETQERNSIIVVPTKSLAYNKSKSTNQKYGGEIYSMYIGSPIKDSGQVDKDKIKDYVLQNDGRKKKFLVVADSLPILISALEDLSIDVYHDYFLMVDEIDTMQSDSVYRPKLENVIDHYLQFDHKQRCMVSATMNEFSNPALEIESCVTTKWRKMPQRNINLIYTNHVDDTAVDEIEALKPTLQDWYNNGKSPIAYQELSRKVDKGIKEKFCDTFKRLCDYIEPERLLSDLEERWDDGRKLRNYNNAVVFWALEDTHPFKTHVLALFNYNDTQTLPNSSNLRMITKEDKEAKMKSVFEHSLRLPQGHLLSPDTMKEYFKCFF